MKPSVLIAACLGVDLPRLAAASPPPTTVLILADDVGYQGVPAGHISRVTVRPDRVMLYDAKEGVMRNGGLRGAFRRVARLAGQDGREELMNHGDIRPTSP